MCKVIIFFQILFSSIWFNYLNAQTFGQFSQTTVIEKKEDLLVRLKKERQLSFCTIFRINEVCKTKGCWADVEFGSTEVNMTFYKESFTLPIVSEGKNAIVQGTIRKNIVSIAALKKEAQDDGRSQGEIDRIKSPLIVYRIIAKGIKLL